MLLLLTWITYWAYYIIAKTKYTFC